MYDKDSWSKFRTQGTTDGLVIYIFLYSGYDMNDRFLCTPILNPRFYIFLYYIILYMFDPFLFVAMKIQPTASVETPLETPDGPGPRGKDDGDPTGTRRDHRERCSELM